MEWNGVVNTGTKFHSEGKNNNVIKSQYKHHIESISLKKVYIYIDVHVYIHLLLHAVPTANAAISACCVQRTFSSD